MIGSGSDQSGLDPVVSDCGYGRVVIGPYLLKTKPDLVLHLMANRAARRKMMMSSSTGAASEEVGVTGWSEVAETARGRV